MTRPVSLGECFGMWPEMARIANMLEKDGIEDLPTLCSMTAAEVLEIPNIGVKALSQIRRHLRIRWGEKLRGDVMRTLVCASCKSESGGAGVGASAGELRGGRGVSRDAGPVALRAATQPPAPSLKER